MFICTRPEFNNLGHDCANAYIVCSLLYTVVRFGLFLVVNMHLTRHGIIMSYDNGVFLRAMALACPI